MEWFLFHSIMEWNKISSYSIPYGHPTCILHCFLMHLSNSWLFWLRFLFFDFISMTDQLFAFELFVFKTLSKNWSSCSLRSRFVLKQNRFFQSIDRIFLMLEFKQNFHWKFQLCVWVFLMLWQILNLNHLFRLN